jgi:GalNAc-alpha-(1->4)-GalNAc-alpha-(1->3)-diNAcBac-PP-undecaprenol alpha-1,4-N-acetyl-D-galactosaminyltransferase
VKILFFNSSLRSGGAERVLTTLANNFSQKEDYKIIVATYLNEEDFYKLSENIKRIKFGTRIGKNIFLKIVKRIQKLYRIRKIVKEEKPDFILPLIVYTNIEVIIACLGLKTKILVTEHSNYWAVKSKLFRILRIITYKLATKAIVLTKKDKDIYNKYLNNVEVIGNPILLNTTKSIEEITNTKRNKTLLCVGTLYHVKQFNHAIEAFSMIHEKYPEWKLLIAGAGIELENLKNLTKILKLTTKVDFLGNVSNIEDLYLTSSIFILSSKYEGLPMVIGEAMLAGLPVVSYDCPTGPSEFIENEISGLLVEHNNKKELASKIEDLILDPEKRDFLSKNAKEKIKEFSVENIIKKWEKQFNEIK